MIAECTEEACIHRRYLQCEALRSYSVLFSIPLTQRILLFRMQRVILTASLGLDYHVSIGIGSYDGAVTVDVSDVLLRLEVDLPS